MRPARAIGVSLWLGCAALAMPAQAQSDDACHRLYDEVTKRAVSIFQDHARAIEQRRAALSSLFEQAVDINWIAQNVAGNYWSSGNDKERQDYLKNFRAYMLSQYINKLDADSIDGLLAFNLVEFTATKPGSYMVRTQITQKDDDAVPVDYTLVEAPAGQCRIHDFTAEGVNLLQVQHEEMMTLGQHGGLSAISKRLGELVKPAS